MRSKFHKIHFNIIRRNLTLFVSLPLFSVFYLFIYLFELSSFASASYCETAHRLFSVVMHNRTRHVSLPV
jgi:hypothetical protein